VSRGLAVASIAAGLLLVGCAARPPLPIDGGGDRVERLDTLPTWSFSGRIAVSDGRDGGSGRVEWRIDGDYYLIEVRAPVAGTTWRLSGGDGLAQLDGVRDEPVRGVDPETLLAREVGWHLPVAAARDWVRGLPVDRRSAQVLLDGDGLPAQIVEQGWRIDYLDWFPAAEGRPALPRRLVARRASHEVRLAVAEWRLGN
jgi:outer membrane lipoprotein LolB